jgi:hypothetical protein
MHKTIIGAMLLTLAVGCVASDGASDPEVSAEGAVGASDSPYDLRLHNPLATSHHVESNRAFNPATNSRYWRVKSGTHLLDGLGRARGEVKNTHSVQINYGQRKNIGGDTLLYTFVTELTDGRVAGGWVFESAFLDDTRGIPTIPAIDPGQGDVGGTSVVAGGDPSKWINLKLTPDYNGANQAPTDYLVRDGGYMNLCYNLPGNGGVATDTFPVGVHFERSHGVAPVSKPLYTPGTKTVVGHMVFVYGHIGSRFGWIAEAALG